jgi:Coenzyme PQQ synthesis protein D (PqqD)
MTAIMDSAAAYYRKVEGLDHSEVMDGYVIYDAPNDRVHFLNATGAIVLELCDGTRTEADMAAFLATSFGLPEQPIEPVRECLSALLSQGLIEPCGPS